MNRRCPPSSHRVPTRWMYWQPWEGSSCQPALVSRDHSSLPPTTLHPDAAWVSFISIWDCERKEPALFRPKALPFGASKSVYSFLRTSHSLWWLACKALSIVWTLYYDDFVCMSSKALASHTDNCVRAFFFLLDWKFSSSGDKHMDFAEVFTALGVTIQLADCLDGRLTICNTAKRTRELVETIGSVLQGGVMSKALNPQHAHFFSVQAIPRQVCSHVAREHPPHGES